MVLWFRRSIWLAVSRMQCSFRETLEKFVFALCLSCMRRALPRANLHFPSFAHAQRVQKCIGKFWHKSFSYSQGENRKGPVCLLLFFMIWQNLELLRGYLYFWNALLIIMIFQNKYCRAVIVGMYEWLSWPQWSLLQYSPPKKSTMVKLTTVKSVTVRSTKGVCHSAVDCSDILYGEIYHGEVHYSEVLYSEVHYSEVHPWSLLSYVSPLPSLAFSMVRNTDSGLDISTDGRSNSATWWRNNAHRWNFKSLGILCQLNKTIGTSQIWLVRWLIWWCGWWWKALVYYVTS